MKFQNLDLPKTSPTTPIKIYCDASNYKNGMSFAGWVFCNHNGRAIDIRSNELGKGLGSKQAEFKAVVRVLDAIEDYDDVQHVKLYTDCQGNIKELNQRRNLEERFNFKSVSVEWVPREKNKLADTVVDNTAMKVM